MLTSSVYLNLPLKHPKYTLKSKRPFPAALVPGGGGRGVVLCDPHMRLFVPWVI